MPKRISLKQTKINDAFWLPYQKLVKDVVIPYQEQILNDEVPGAEKSHAMANFRIAAGEETGEFYGMVFQDSDVAKWLEAVAYSLEVFPDTDLEERADAVIDLLAKAQGEDGYLDTYFMIKEPQHRWMNMLEGHELYCMGHLMEAAAAYYDVTRKEKILRIAEGMTDYIASVFGEDKRYGIPGHEEVEIGLMRMYDVTGEEKYRDLAAYFINARGTQPDFFVEEKKKRDFSIFDMDPENRSYYQGHLPVREQTSAEGHAVRAVYLYRAMADLAYLQKDESLYKACRTIWENITQKKMYITGGVGSCGDWEAFSIDYDLPGDRAYAETCAQIGLVFFAKAMLDTEKKGEYADIMERCLYNSTISGMQLDGKHFFYVNPLEVNPGFSGEIFGMKHVLPQRPEWYACACCPPNLARMILSLGRICWNEEEDTIYSHLMIGQEASLEKADITLESRYPWEGYASYKVEPKCEKEFALAIHIPSYVNKEELKVLCNKEEITTEIRDGYLYLLRKWKAGDKVAISFPMHIRRMYGTTRILDMVGKTALMRGPVVYCIEGVDNGEQIQALRLPRASEILEERGTGDVLENVIVLKAKGIREQDGEDLYAQKPPDQTEVELTAIPYYLWGNRGLSQMRVWIRE